MTCALLLAVVAVVAAVAILAAVVAAVAAVAAATVAAVLVAVLAAVAAETKRGECPLKVPTNCEAKSFVILNMISSTFSGRCQWAISRCH